MQIVFKLFRAFEIKIGFSLHFVILKEAYDTNIKRTAV